MSENDPVYGKYKYENKCKVTFEFDCMATADVTKCRFWSGTIESCNNWQLLIVPKGSASKYGCKLKYAQKWAILRKLKDYFGEDIIQEVKKQERD